MKTINSNNCEAWMLDYFEGNLSSGQSQVLMQFLEAHPEWQKEFDEFALTEEPAEINPQPTEEEGLSMPPGKMHDRDEDLIALTEGLLNDADSARLMKQISTDDKLAADYAIYLKIVLRPNSEIKFAYKNKLKKKGIVVPLILRYSAVAAMFCGALIAAWLFNNTLPAEQNVATENTIEKGANELKNEQLADEMLPNQEDMDLQSDDVAEQNSQTEISQPAKNVSTESSKSSGSNPNSSTLAKNQDPQNLNSEKRSEVLIAAIEPQPISNNLVALSAEHILPGNLSDVPPSAATAQWSDTEQTGGIAGLINNIGQNLLGKVKEVADEQIIVEQKKQPEEEIYTSTFKLGSFEVYRSRTKK